MHVEDVVTRTKTKDLTDISTNFWERWQNVLAYQIWGDCTVQVCGIKLDNRWFVPYNPFLLLKYNAHIDVEISNICANTYTKAMIELS